MKNFMDKNFLLQTETAQELYHNHAAKMPIIDYHCHLNRTPSISEKPVTNNEITTAVLTRKISKKVFT